MSENEGAGGAFHSARDSEKRAGDMSRPAPRRVTVGSELKKGGRMELTRVSPVGKCHVGMTAT